uniref:peptidoglycan glycosyltransferase n=1 Tax=Nephroselmis pyriformis TaxID=156128 RepID=A0A8A2H8H2_9CHLO|nr:putative plastid division protein [Nephroselmis pyriformis]QSV37313.1 putative plastid division protein [Nephroselmis pyriformis]
MFIFNQLWFAWQNLYSTWGIPLGRYIFPMTDPQVRYWPPLARWIQWLTFFWLSIGLWFLISASYPSGQLEFGDGLYYVRRQLAWILIGLWGFHGIIHQPLRNLLKMSRWGLCLSGLAILATLVQGVVINGSSRWLAMGPILLQPSEWAKPFLILEASRLFGLWPSITWRVRLLWLTLMALMVLGILAQPNLSTAGLCGLLLWLLAWLGGLSKNVLLGVGCMGGGVGILSLSLREYQRNRIISFLNPWNYSTDEGYQLVQSLLAVGSGGIQGSGWGLSHQKLFYLPIQYTDFIFSVLAEETGLIGGWLLLGLLGGYGIIGFLIGLQANDPIHRLIALGSVMTLVGQSILNLGVAIGILPTTGLPLPFFSYGGNAVVSSLWMAGLLIRVARESRTDLSP